jgi:hypothetical protein
MAKKKPKDLVSGDKQEIKRDSKGRFVKGQSGNKEGRQKIPEDIKQAFRSLAPDCCRVLCSIVNDESARHADRIKAAEVILDRGFGKPVQAVDLDASSIPQVVFMGADDIAD